MTRDQFLKTYPAPWSTLHGSVSSLFLTEDGSPCLTVYFNGEHPRVETGHRGLVVNVRTSTESLPLVIGEHIAHFLIHYPGLISKEYIPSWARMPVYRALSNKQEEIENMKQELLEE